MGDLIIYLLVRTNLKMGKGKIATQCGHAIESLVMKAPKPVMHAYKRNGHPKICLKVPDFNELEDIRIWCQQNKIPHHLVIDAGKTELPPDTETVLGIGPIERSRISSITKKLKLL